MYVILFFNLIDYIFIHRYTELLHTITYIIRYNHHHRSNTQTQQEVQAIVHIYIQTKVPGLR